METRCCRHLHFISAIESGTVTKVRNVSSCGKPALRSKSLKDVFESEDGEKISSDSAAEDNKLLPLADRTCWKEDLGSSEFVRNDYDDDDSDMSDDSSMTLSQLKEITKRKKQKLSYCTHSNAKWLSDDFQFGDDEFDLKEPLSQWKQKLSKKKLKRKRKSSSKRAIKLELANRDLMPLVCVNREDTEVESFEVPSAVDFIDSDELEYDSEIPYYLLEGHGYKNQELVLYGDRYQEYLADSPEDIEKDGCDSLQEVLCIEESRNCALNEVFSDYLEPTPLLESSASDAVNVSNEMMSCQPHVVSSRPESETNNKSDNIVAGSTREFVMPQKEYSNDLTKTSGQSSCSSGVQAFDTAVNSKFEIIDSLPPVTQNEPFSLQLSVSSLDSHTSSINDDESVSTIDVTVERDQTRACSPTVASKDCWSSRNHCPHVLATSEKQPPGTVSIDSECGSSSWNAPFLDDCALSGPVQNPGRFTHKIIPPTSQERLCMALSCEELPNDVDEFTCKEKLFLDEQNRNPSILRSNIEAARGAGNTVQPGQLHCRKAVISNSQILQKSKNENRGSPPEFSLEQPSYSRSLPSITTGCTSVTSCSKGAVAFSQRQMHDIDSLSGKLLNELKSLKDIVEQKLLFNPCRNLTLRNDADEVVEAIKAATRVEKKAKRFLSAMARDCDRYCKIMSLTQDGPSPRENDIHREKKKIAFADEAGGILHHVEFFDNESSSLPPLAPSPDNQNC